MPYRSGPLACRSMLLICAVSKRRRVSRTQTGMSSPPRRAGGAFAAGACEGAAMLAPSSAGGARRRALREAKKMASGTCRWHQRQTWGVSLPRHE